MKGKCIDPVQPLINIWELHKASCPSGDPTLAWVGGFRTSVGDVRGNWCAQLKAVVLDTGTTG